MAMEALKKLFGRGPKKGRRARTPTVLQMEAVECGAASLAIVLGYYDCYVPLEELRVACSVSRDGTSAKNVVRAARDYKLTAKGFKKELKQLRQLPTPAILFWNFNHFIVLEGFKGSRVFINDPASGPREISEDELDESFTGVVLTFEPMEDFKPRGEKPAVLRPLLTRLAGSRKDVLFAVLAGLALVPPGLAIPIFSQFFVDKYLVANMKEWLFPLLIGMGLTALLRAGLSYLQQYYLLRLRSKLSISFSSKFFWHVLRLPYEFYTQRYSGEIGSRVALNNQVAGLLSGRLASTFLDLLMVVFYGALLVFYDWGMTLLGIVSMAGNLLILKAVSRRRVDGTRRLVQYQGKLMGSFMGGLQQIETLKATGGELDFFQRVSGYQAKIINSTQEMAQKTMLLNLCPTFLSTIVNATVLALGAYRVMQGDMTMGMLVAFQSLMSSFIGPVTSLIGLGGELQTMHGSLNRLDDVLRNEVDPQVEDFSHQTDSDQEIGRLSGKIDIRDITFGYSRLGQPLISNFSCTLEPGARIALVGGSGSGKSTLARVLCGLFQPWSGDILFDGQRRQEIPRRALANSIAFVDQDIVLFEGSIRDNLTMWDSTVPDAEVIRAGEDAAIHDDIAARPGGYEARVSENGQNYSGGQRQRLEIARALVNRPSILVLDEATSALDPVTEQIIDRNLRRRGCTCIIVAHRLSTIRDCDEIIVLQQGNIVQRGTHEELIEQEGGFYHQIVSSTT
jgi:NHLM bacteriocin system ABC transporter peptidase/ATP-binding protein